MLLSMFLTLQKRGQIMNLICTECFKVFIDEYILCFEKEEWLKKIARMLFFVMYNVHLNLNILG